jgi:hypothetical protein
MKPLDYEALGLIIDPEKGTIHRLIECGGRAKDNGYVHIKLNGRTYCAHRVIWEYKFGPIPHGMQIDHINGVRNDNRIENLRLATHAQNAQNRKLRTDNTSGHVGVTYKKQSRRWEARIDVDGERIVLGFFLTKEEAIQARIAAKAKLHSFNPVERNK